LSGFIKRFLGQGTARPLYIDFGGAEKGYFTQIERRKA